MKIDRESSKKNETGFKLTPILLSMVMIGSGISLTGCSTELAPDNSNIDILSTNADSASELSSGIEQLKEIDGESFQLLINYYSNDNEWHINSNKNLYIAIRTKNLPDNLEVYIDNIHMDTSIVSTKAGYNGIVQDTMDDRIHNSLMIGFPISDKEYYYGINTIEGENQEFIKGYVYGNKYYTTGTVEEKRRLESDYLEDGVYANRIDSVIDLIIVDKETGKPLRQKSVDSKLLVEINNIVSFEENGSIKTYKYNRDGSREEVSTKTR